MQIPVFNPNAECPKCGAHNATTRYCPGKAAEGHVAGCEFDGEHLHRRCARCGHERIELPLDAAEE